LKLLNIFKKIKPGYYILFFIFLTFYSCNRYNALKEYELSLQNKINNLLTFLKSKNFFKFQEELNGTLKHKISIENIKNYSNAINLDANSTFLLKNLDKKDNNLIFIKGVIINKNMQKKANFILIENNKTFYLLNSKIENLEIIDINKTFPLK
jgi:hypothetical protein